MKETLYLKQGRVSLSIEVPKDNGSQSLTSEIKVKILDGVSIRTVSVPLWYVVNVSNGIITSLKITDLHGFGHGSGVMSSGFGTLLVSATLSMLASRFTYSSTAKINGATCPESTSDVLDDHERRVGFWKQFNFIPFNTAVGSDVSFDGLCINITIPNPKVAAYTEFYDINKYSTSEGVLSKFDIAALHTIDTSHHLDLIKNLEDKCAEFGEQSYTWKFKKPLKYGLMAALIALFDLSGYMPNIEAYTVLYIVGLIIILALSDTLSSKVSSYYVDKRNEAFDGYVEPLMKELKGSVHSIESQYLGMISLFVNDKELNELDIPSGYHSTEHWTLKQLKAYFNKIHELQKVV